MMRNAKRQKGSSGRSRGAMPIIPRSTLTQIGRFSKISAKMEISETIFFFKNRFVVCPGKFLKENPEMEKNLQKIFKAAIFFCKNRT